MHPSNSVLTAVLLPASAFLSLSLAHPSEPRAAPGGTASPATSDPLPGAPATVGTRLLDLDGDGALDILGLHADGSLSVQRNVGPRRFARVEQVLPSAAVQDVLCTDLDGDGRVDLYLVSPGADLALLGEGGGRFRDGTCELGLVESGPGLTAERRDVDGDGLQDLVVHNQGSDVLFWARGDGAYTREERTADGLAAPVATGIPTAAGVLVDPAAPNGSPADQTGTSSTSSTSGSRGALAGSAGAPSSSSGLVAAPTTPTPTSLSFTFNMDPRYVNDNMNEVGSADIVDGSLTGADVSTSSGNVTFGGGATVTATKGTFGFGSTASGGYSTVSGGYYNAASGTNSTVSGGYGNSASVLDSTVSGGRSNVASGGASTVSGGVGNSASGGVSTVSGGMANSALGNFSTVSGGRSNVASGGASTVSGGYGNSASSYSTVSGGYYNAASGTSSMVSGGALNAASGYCSTVAGGSRNSAQIGFSFAAGRLAKANHVGSFVWGDSVFVDKTSSAADQFNVYAEGGMRVFAVGQSTSSLEVNASGNVGVGTATPEGGLSVFAQKTNGTPSEQGVHMGREFGGYASSTTVEIVSGSTGASALDFNALGSGQADFGARLRWDRPSDTLFLDGANLCASVICPSSARFKENVTPLMGALEAVLQLQGVRFDWRPEEAEKRGFTHDFGFIAEEVREVIPEVVLVDKDGLVIGVDYARLSAFLVEAVKEQQKAFEEQQREIEALEAVKTEVASLKAALATLLENR